MPDGTAEQAAEAAKKAAEAEANKSRTYSVEEFKAVIAQRDEVKAKLREREEAEKKVSEAKLLEDGKVKELLTQRERELEELKGVKEKLAVYEAAEAARREKLLKALPEKKRELYQGVPMEALEDIVEQLTEDKPNKAAKAGSAVPEKLWELMADEERQELKASNPTLYKAKYNEWYLKKNGRLPPFTV